MADVDFPPPVITKWLQSHTVSGDALADELARLLIQVCGSPAGAIQRIKTTETREARRA